MNHNICIDFGTCNSVISYYLDNILYQIPDENTGDVLIPTVIYFISESINSDTKISNLEYEKNFVIGSSANDLYSSDKNLNLYFYQFKRFLGITSRSINSYKEFLDKFGLEYDVDEDTIYFYIQSFNSDNKIKLSIINLITIYFKGLYSMIKQKLGLNNQSETKSNPDIEVVLTCPAYFHDLQRSQLKRAAEEAGFKINKIYNEPTAAAIYYISKYKKTQSDGSIQSTQSDLFIIYDLGGGTIDTTVVRYLEFDNTCEVVDIDGNNGLGGIDIDNVLISDIYSKYNIDKENIKWKSKIRKAAEEIKIALTYNDNHNVFLESVPIKLMNKIQLVDNLKISYSRHGFNTLINVLIEQMIIPIKNMCEKYETSNIIFIGGPTQIPLLQNKVNSFLNLTNKNNFDKQNNSDKQEPNNITGCKDFDQTNTNLYKTIVSQGGSLIYKMINEKTTFYLLDIIPMNIGISNPDGDMVVMIEKNSKIPLNVEKIFSTSHDCQRVIDIEIYEGTDSKCTSNTFIGSYKIIGIPPLPRGMILIKLLFKISYNGILNISINGFKNPSDNSAKSFDFKMFENIKLIPNILAKDILRKLLVKKLNN